MLVKHVTFSFPPDSSMRRASVLFFSRLVKKNHNWGIIFKCYTYEEQYKQINVPPGQK